MKRLRQIVGATHRGAMTFGMLGYLPGLPIAGIYVLTCLAMNPEELDRM